MGQAPDVLPDPTNSPALANAASTDDLLAQLAGEEIDRLLADESLPKVEGEPAELPIPTPDLPTALATPAAAPVSREAAEDPDADTQRQLDDLFAQLAAVEPVVPEHVPQPAPARPAAPSADAEAMDSVISQQLDDLFAQLQEDQGGQPAKPAAAMPAPVQPIVPSVPSVPPVPAAIAEKEAAAPAGQVAKELDPADQTSDLERQVLAADLLEKTTPAEEPPAEEPVAEDVPAEPRVPIWVRLLELLNAPLANASEAIHDVVGKAAIVTLVNALLILLYVLFVRG